MKQRLDSFAPSLREQAQARASAHLHELITKVLPSLAGDGTNPVVAVFSALPSEPSPVKAASAALGAENLAWPQSAGESMVFAQSPPDLLQAAPKWGSLEPPPFAPEVKPSLVVLPGRAFDFQGRRLGRGGGFYDKALESLPQGTVLVGFCFAIQVVDALPVEAHDRPVHWLVTEEGALLCRPVAGASP